MSTKYCVWNNKGGVGKTFLTYSLAVEYAEKNPEKNIVVIDLCPQANVSSMILGGNGDGEEELKKVSDTRRTIADYIKQRNDGSRYSRTGMESIFVEQASIRNHKMPKNLFLIAGDIDLDLCSYIIDNIASEPRRTSWRTSRLMLLDIIKVFEEMHADKKNVFFIDTNPSFANYTQLGILASDRLIIPCTADSFSLRAIYNVLRLVYGKKIGTNPIDEENDYVNFFDQVQTNGLPLPKIHSLILNRSRTFDKKASVAYRSHTEEIRERIQSLRSEFPDLFLSEYKNKNIVYDVKDCNTISAVLNYTGEIPSKLRQKIYNVYGKRTVVNDTQKQPYLENLNSIIASL